MDWITTNYFDILDDEHDSIDFTTVELNRYFSEGRIEVAMAEEEDDMIEDNVELSEKEDEKVLSQKLSQLSTKAEDDGDNSSRNSSDNEEDQHSLVKNQKRRLSPLSDSDVISKKMKMTTDDHDHVDGTTEKEKDYSVPTYLSLTNASFNHFVQNLIDTTNPISIQDVQYIALCQHRIAALHIQKQVTMIYFKSGTGTLRDSEPELIPIDRRVWPVQVKSAMVTQRSTNTTMIDIIDPENEQLAYENLVQQRLQEMNQQTDQYEKDLDEKKRQLTGFTSTMENRIRKYVQQYGIQPLKLKRNLKIALLKHDYDAEIIERKFLQEKPNEYQIQTAKCLYEARNELEKTKRELLELKQRVFYNKQPPLSFDSTIVQISNEIVSMKTQQQQASIRRKKLDLIALHILKLEQKLYQCQKIFDDKLSNMWKNHRNLVQDKGMPTTLSNLIEKRFTNITDRWRDIYIFRILYHVQAPYGDWEVLEKKKQQNSNETQLMKTIGFQPQIIIDTKHPFTDQQLQLLNRGPTYVPPCQIHVSSSSSSLDDILKKQYAPLKHQLAYLFNKYEINVALQFTIQHDVYDLFTKCFSMSLPPEIHKRAQDEQTLIQTIRLLLKNNNLILRRTADNMNTFYLGNSQDFERQADEYMTKANHFKIFFTTNQETNQQAFCTEMNKLIEFINHALSILRRRNELDEKLYNRLRLDATKVKLPYLYFLPNVSQENNVTLSPIITSQHSVTYKISKYLDQLLRPFANEEMKSVIFRDGIQFMQKLYDYVHTEHRLTSTTMFCTIQISNYLTLDYHEAMINVVCNFIQKNVATNKLQKISIMTIKNLLQLCLYNNIFSYKNKIYTFTKGGPITSPLTDTLANIYLFVWQQKIIDEIKQNRELFGRYKDQLFFTWNGFKNELDHFLETISERYPQVQLRTFIDTSVPFLNAYVVNRDGRLYTRVYHDPTIQPYTLPYLVGHPKVNYSDWIRTALIQAVCYCTSVDDFNQERIYIELTCLANGYSLQFVDSRVSHFYDYFQANTLRYSLDQILYYKFRRQWFNFTDIQRAYSNNLQHLSDNGHLIRLHYLYEFGAKCQFNQEFHKLWNKHFGTNPILCKEKTAIHLTTKHLHSLNALLCQHKSLSWSSFLTFL